MQSVNQQPVPHPHIQALGPRYLVPFQWLFTQCSALAVNFAESHTLSTHKRSILSHHPPWHRRSQSRRLFLERSGGTVKRCQGQGLLWAVTCSLVPSAHSTLFFQAPFCPSIPSLQTRNSSYSTLHHITIHPPLTPCWAATLTCSHSCPHHLPEPVFTYCLAAVLAWPLEKAEGKCLPEQILIRTF